MLRMPNVILSYFCDFIHLVPSQRKDMSVQEYRSRMFSAMFKRYVSQEDLDALRLTLSLFFAERAQKAIDKMWDEGTFDQKKLDELRGQHLRTPYK